MKRDKLLAFFLLYWILYSGLIRIFLFKNEIFTIIPDCILLYLSIKVYKRYKRPEISKYIYSCIPILCTIFLIIGTISMLINGCFIIPYFWNIRFYLRALLVFYIIWQVMTIKDCWKYRKIMYHAFIPNFIFCIIENYTGKSGDALGGLFGGGNMEMVLYLMLIIFFATADYYNKLLSRLKFISIMTISLLLSFWGEIKLLYIVIPLFWYIGNILFNKFRFKQIATLIIGLFLFIPIMQFFLSFFYNETYVESIFTLEKTKAYTNESSFIVGQEDGMNRSSSIKMTNELILKDIPHLLSGYGIGASSTSQIFRSPIGSQYLKTYFFLFTPSYIMTETGWLGLILYLSIYLLLLCTFLRYYKYRDPVLKYWSSLGILCILIIFILIWYNITPILIFLIVYYFLAFCLVGIRDRINTLRKLSEQKLLG